MDDGTLLRFLDGEAAADEREMVARHLATCPDCAADAESLRAASAGVHLVLERDLGDAPAPPPLPRIVPPASGHPRAARPSHYATSSRRLLAAGILLAVALGAAAPPVRALVRSLVTRVREAMAPDRVPSPPPAGEHAALPPTPAPDEVLVEFTPEGTEIVVDFGAAQQGGTLVVRTHDGESVVLSTTPGAPRDVLVLPGGVRVRNAPTSTHSYRLLVPAGLRRIIVRVGGETVSTTDADALRRGETVVRLGPGG